MKKTKKKAQQAHSERRFMERYGLRCTQRLTDHLRHAIHNNKATKIKQQSLRVRVYEVVFTPQRAETKDETLIGKPMLIRFVYDKNRNQVVTALPLDGVDLKSEVVVK